MDKRTVSSKVLAALVGAAVMIQAQAPALASAADEQEYISEVYLGYKTTTDKDSAIRDMRAMNMNGNYSYDEYEKVLENKKSEINAFISSMKTAVVIIPCQERSVRLRGI